ncbi:hypothetical protein [Streptomyces sp. NPDC007007]|uniref:hypothetical protein n=1 Tax=Streptomyces sp. NPDC007007 TaxID=3364770 RepID=UPI00368BFEED
MTSAGRPEAAINAAEGPLPEGRPDQHRGTLMAQCAVRSAQCAGLADTRPGQASMPPSASIATGP